MPLQNRVAQTTALLLTALLLTATLLTAMSFHDVAAAEPHADEKPKLIAHRGGVVDQERIENSLSGLEAAIERRYWMVEADIRESKDGQAVVHHDVNFRRYYGDGRKVAEMTWEEIRQLRSSPGNVRPLLFREFAGACRGKMRLMLDIKSPDHPKPFYEAIEKALRENALLDSTFVIGTSKGKAYFKGKARVSVNKRGLRTAIKKGEEVAKLYFLFEHAKGLNERIINQARQAGVPVVVSVNTFHYPITGHMKKAKADILRLRSLGLRHFQIDSVYDRWLRSK